MELTIAEMKKMRFPGRMNLLQLACNEGAVQVLTLLHEVTDAEERRQMVTHRDAHLGSMAIHFAAATGKDEVIQILVRDFDADVADLTSETQQSVMHCAAQRFAGIYTIFLFASWGEVPTNPVDDNDATPLHFAALSGLLKNVQALIKFGADVNS